jgi:hypothetical protein
MRVGYPTHWLVTLAILLTGCHHARRVPAASEIAALDAEIFPVLAVWATGVYGPGPFTFDPTPSDKWSKEHSALGVLPAVALSKMEGARRRALITLKLVARPTDSLDVRCPSSRAVGTPASSERGGCPAAPFVHLAVTVPYHSAATPQLGGYHRPDQRSPDSAYAAISRRRIGPEGWTLLSQDVVLGRTSAGWAVVRVGPATYVE